jgi:asparagine synthase (glutamine-hydrolysing)
MCGIVGAMWNGKRRSISAETLDSMTDILSHRGPDGRGTYAKQFPSGTGIAIGHRRLAIIDLEGGHQPLSNEDGTVWITFNGEIYNFRELRHELEARGHRFQTDSDTETIVHLYEDLGPQCLHRLRGMFAFAIWDSRQQLLLMARDRLGQKPLVYRQIDDQLLFASEIKAILQVPGIRREVDAEALNQYLTFGYVPHPRTMFRGINKLPPAHYAIYRRGQLCIHRYWQPDWSFESDLPLADLREQLREELEEAVRLRLRSDVPIGAFLSGGIDSTVIVGLMQRLLPHAAKTFSMGFQEAAYDETPFARQAALHLGTEHLELAVNPSSANLLQTLTRQFDEPFADSSAIPTFGLAQATRAQVKVALTGDGGDELFAGYARYHTIERLRVFDRLPKFVRCLVANNAWQLLPGSDGQVANLAKLRFRMQMLRKPSNERYINWVSYFHQAGREFLLSPDYRRQLQETPEDWLIDKLRCSNRSPSLQAMQCDLQTYLPSDLLAKVDITSMAHGLECRSPFLDHRVVELALAIPFCRHQDSAVPKPMLTHTFAAMIPPQLQVRAKMGFCVPLDAWFRGPLKSMVHDMLLSAPLLARGNFQATAIRSLMCEHESGRWNHGERIWNLMCLEQWHRDYIDCGDFRARLSAVAPKQLHEVFLDRNSQKRSNPI